ncbi:MAG: polysaccharide biosynthesis tyrosine autokinase [Eubacteriales bacterium]|nr:polysaccharide biosynthesis tyrosine autokinase [Eubacteriales bacterium]
MSTQSSHKTEQTDIFTQVRSFNDYLKTIPRMWAMFLVLALIGAVVGYFVANKTYTPVYTASSTFTVNIKNEQSITMQSDFYDNIAAEQMAQTFPYILTSDLLQRKVEADLGTPITGEINASVVENTNLLTLSVTDKDPQMAYKTLESVIKNYPYVSESVVGKVTMNTLDETGIPTKPDNPMEYRRTILSCVLIGLFIAFLWSFLIFIVNRTILHKSEIKNKLGLNLLGSIPKINIKKRSNSPQNYFLITDENVKGIIEEPFRMVRNKIEYIAQKNKYKTFLITSAIPTEGKSLFAANLSLSLASCGNKVVLIDCDMRHPTGRSIFGLEQGNGLYEYLNEEISLSEYIDIAKSNNPYTTENFMFLPGGKAIADGSTLLFSERMEQLLNYVQEQSDYVIIDSAPTGILTDSVTIAKYVDAGILVIRQDYATIDIINDALSHLSESDTSIIGGVLNEA